MESHVLEGDNGPGPRETEAPYSFLTTSFPEAKCEQRPEQLSALTPISLAAAETVGCVARVAVVPPEGSGKGQEGRERKSCLSLFLGLWNYF